MDFKEKYTTAELIAKDPTAEKKEKDKFVLSNDMYALGQLLETLINRRGV